MTRNGEERTIEAARKVRNRIADDVLRAIFADADQFTPGAPQHDDMAMLILKLD
jgi:sigma-B regulation protein RsbU (phosphoserine phosphatase)